MTLDLLSLQEFYKLIVKNRKEVEISASRSV